MANGLFGYVTFRRTVNGRRSTAAEAGRRGLTSIARDTLKARYASMIEMRAQSSRSTG